MIACLWRDFFAVWDMRNEHRHGRDSSVKAKRVREQVIREVEVLFKLACEIHPDDVEIFDNVTLEDLVKTSTGNMYAWKENWESAIIESKARAKAEGICA